MSTQSLDSLIIALTNIDEVEVEKTIDYRREKADEYYELKDSWREGKIELSPKERILFKKIMKNRGLLDGIRISDTSLSNSEIEALLFIQNCKDIDEEMKWW